MACASSSPTRKPIFNKHFFSTVQLVFAGSDSQGLRYGTTGTPEQFFVQWKDEEGGAELEPGTLLDKPLAQMCRKARLLDLIRNFIIFDAGQKKVPAAAPVFRHQGRPGAHRQARGWRDLAYPGQRQEHPDGAAGQVADGARPGGAHPGGHRPRRAGQADHGRDAQRRGGGRGRPLAADHLTGAVRRKARRDHAAAAVRPGAQVRPRRPEGRAAAGPRAFLCVRGRVSPHPGRRYEPADEALAGGCHLHRLYRHAAAAQGQADHPRGVRHLYPYLQVPPGGPGQRGSGPEVRGPRCAPAPDLAREGRCLVRAQDQEPQQLPEGGAAQALGDPGRA